MFTIALPLRKFAAKIVVFGDIDKILNRKVSVSLPFPLSSVRAVPRVIPKKYSTQLKVKYPILLSKKPPFCIRLTRGSFPPHPFDGGQ
jgi:hypothetical protein